MRAPLYALQVSFHERDGPLPRGGTPRERWSHHMRDERGLRVWELSLSV